MKKITKVPKSIIAIITLSLFITFFSAFSVEADEVVTYNANEWENFSSRTKQTIADKYSEAIYAGKTYRDGNSDTYYEITPEKGENANVGKLTTDTHLEMTEMANLYRWLVGAQPLTRVSNHSYDLQAGALSRPNYNYGHDLSGIAKPDDIPQDIWDAGSDVLHNILAYGSTPRRSIVSWVDEGYSIYDQEFDTIGHRLFIISQNISALDFGYTYNTAIGVGSINADPVAPYTAYPAAGYMPTELIVPSSSAWSIELNTDAIQSIDDSSIVVTVKNLDTNESYTCTEANGKLNAYKMLGMHNTYNLVFVQPETEGYRYADGEKYEVKVTGLQDVATGNEAQLIYTTEFFKVNDYANTIAEGLTTVEGYDTVYLTEDYNNLDDLEKIAAILPKELEIITETNREAIIPVIGDWVVDQENKVFTNTADLSKIPSYVTDPDNVIGKVEIEYSIMDYTGSFGINVLKPTEGLSGSFTLRPYYISVDKYAFYQFNKTDNGYNVIERGNQDSSNVTVGGNYATLNFDSFSLTDSGTYMGIYTVGSLNPDIYVAGIKNIEVQEKSISSISLETAPQTTYQIGDNININNAKITLNYIDSTTKTIDLTSDMITNFTTTTAGVKTMTVTYKDRTLQIDYLVLDNLNTINAKYGNTLSDVQLPTSEYGTYTFNDPETTSVGNIGTKTFKATFTPNDSKYTTLTNIDISINVEKADPTYSSPITVEATYNNTLADVQLPTSDIGKYEFEQLLTTSVGNVGTNENFTVKFTPNNSDNYNVVTNIPVIMYVKKAIPSYTVPTNLVAGFGDTLKDVILPEGFSWNNPDTSVGDVGNNKFSATFTPNDTNNYETVTDVEITIKVDKTTPEYIVPQNLEATYNQSLKDISLPTASNGIYSFVDDLTTKVGEVGTNEFEVKFTPNDTNNYREVIMKVQIVVNKANPEYIVPTNLKATYTNKLYNITLPTSDIGKFEWTNENLSVGEVGINKFSVKFIPTDTKNYNTIENIEVSVQVEKANPSYTIPNNLTVEFNKTLKDVILPEGFSWKNENQSVGDVGTKTFEAIYTPQDTKNYNIVSVNIEINVTKIIPNYDIPQNLEATYGDKLGSINLPEGFSWNNPDTLVGNAGSKTFLATYTPQDTENYAIVNNIEIPVLVNKKLADKVEIPTINEIIYNENTTLGSITLPQGWSWDNPNTVPTVNNNGYKITYTPQDTINYDYSNQNLNPTINIIVKKAIPNFSAPIVTAYSGNTLNDIKLPTLSNGTFTWQDDLNTSVGSVGTQTFKVTFTPNDTNNYEIVTDIEATVEVGKAYPTFTIPQNLEATYGDKLSSINLPEGFSWNNPDTLVGNAGSKTFLATYTPQDTENYAIVNNIEIPVLVNKKLADKVEIPTINEIIYNENTTLGSITLPQGWSWDNPNTVPTVNNNGYKITYTPQDTINYDYSNQNLNPTINITVKKANPNYEIPTNITIEYGSSLEEIKLANGFSFQDSGVVNELGKKTYKLVYTPQDTENYNIITDIEVTVTVTKATPNIEIPNDITIPNDEILSLKDIDLPQGWKWVDANTKVTTSGKYKAIYTPEDTEHYNTVTKEINIIIEDMETTSQTNKNDFIDEEITVPNTNDNLGTYITLLVLSSLSLLGLGIRYKLRKN